MGNSASNASNPSTRTTTRDASPPPKPGIPHPSLRTKKRSLELPDLASLSLAQHHNPRGRQTKPIAIPTTPPPPFSYNQPQPTQRARHLPSTTDILPTADVNITPPLQQNFPPFPPAPRPNPAPRGRQQPISPKQQQQQAARMKIQELYNQSQQPTHSPSRHHSFQQEVVRSSIPVALTKALPNLTPPAADIVQQEYPQKEDLLADFVPVKIIWKGGGTRVVLARAGDAEWKGRELMEKESANVWTLTVMLRPGTHHVRFLVDGQWRVADDLPAAVDDQGSLANYVAVPFPAPASAPTLAPPPPVTRDKLVPGQSFWSADSSADGESEHQPQPQQQQSHTARPSQSAKWTNILPPELIEAAREEEAYLSASAGQYDSESNIRVTTGFVPAPNIPPAPGLPRHLEKLILNTRVGAPGAAGTGTGARSGLGQAIGGVGSMGLGSGQGQARRDRKDRERENDKERNKRDRERDRERERDKDRERDRERGERVLRKRATTAAAAAVSIPPAPPPSEDGEPSSWAPPGTHIVATTSLPEISSIGATAVGSVDLGGTTNVSSAIPTPPTISTNTSTATTTPQTSLPSTPAPMSPILPKTGENSTGPENSPTMSPTRSPVASANASPNPNTHYPTPTTTPPSTSFISSSHFSTSTPTPIPSGSRTITIDTSNMPSLSDDGSVLPVPSHVVLHHLSTSAIKNGVLAVGNTIRYRKKYLTTIYYKPT